MNNLSNYSWRDIDTILKEELQNKDSIAIFAVIGSKDINHDIDIIAIKNPEIKSSEYVSQIHELLDNTNNRLNDKYGKKLIRFSCFNNQEEALHLGKYDNGDLALHLMTYPSYQQMILDWTPDINSNANMEEILKKSTILKGDLNSIDYLKTQERGKHANIYQKINDCDITNSNYEDKLCLKKMNELFRYIGKNIRLGKEYSAKTLLESRKILYEILDKMDTT
ncbi:TPA: hypothetical protein HA235_04200 [Candidatus Woesearchaeota archaeon]|nr:hypothetical protein [uncultured archaeon]MBS3173024.1 hypothetical protein [Candidatus Woesearchaeota archaeon]AQS32933.1 hypothetical protein [uncultured archaeon]HIH31886.1 hypothetical protein [Candidatus Woesearchaeota archaeon]HIH54363.1 hypothetical protein [Candidatus Woesearchaeota archaeon]